MSDERAQPRDVAEWLKNATADAERRGLPDLEPLLENLAQATAVLRAADWNDDAGAEQAPRAEGTPRAEQAQHLRGSEATGGRPRAASGEDEAARR